MGKNLNFQLTGRLGGQKMDSLAVLSASSKSSFNIITYYFKSEKTRVRLYFSENLAL